MGVQDSPLDILEKLQAWVSFSASDLSPFFFSGDFQMSNNCVRACCECGSTASDKFFTEWHCQSCDRWSCAECYGVHLSDDAERLVDDRKTCKSCCTAIDLKLKHKTDTENMEHNPSPGLQGSPELESPSNYESGHNDRLALYFAYRDCGYSPDAVTSGSVTTISALPSPISVHSSSIRNDRDEAEYSRKLFYSPRSEYLRNISDIDSNSVCARLEFNSCKSEEVSLSDSPISVFSSHRAGHSANLGEVGSPLPQLDSPFDKTSAVFRRLELEKGTDDLTHTTDNGKPTLQNPEDKTSRKLDFECNGLIWFIPPSEYGSNDAGSNFLPYHDDDDIGDSGTLFPQSSSFSSTFSLAENQNEVHIEPLRVVIQGHFTALVSHLLHGEPNKLTINESNAEWLDIISKVAWQAANYVKPDTSRGGSMDPTDYVKIKCIASGNPGDSTVVRGVVCTKNTKHKRMITQYKSPRLLLLAGALEYQSISNHLTSFNTLVQQENDHLKMFMSKIESFRPNVLLVEKSVSPNAQEYLLAKEISLVLNVKKPLLDRIARCTGALVASAAADDFTAHLGSCELFHVERISEEHEANNLPTKKNSKTLMFFDGCPRRLGCTVLLRGACREELKILKNIVQYAVFAAYHLSLETSFLADEGASLPKMAFRNSIDDASLSFHPNYGQSEANNCVLDDEFVGHKFDHFPSESLYANLGTSESCLSLASMDCYLENSLSSACLEELASSLPSDIEDGVIQEERMHEDADGSMKSERMMMGKNEGSDKYFQATDTSQSILVSFSRRCVVKGAVCERSRLLRIKFYGSFDKPLGRYLQDDLFDRTSCCRSCKEPSEDHVLCYTHEQGNLTINVRYLPSAKLPGKEDGKIWMWHRCLRCAPIDGVPPATRKVVMSDAAWGLSFGKFLELSFSNNATANRLAPCGHSLQRDCLRFYGYGSMVAFFCFSAINILNVHMPSPELDFNGHVQRERIEKEAAELLNKMKALYMEISDVLCVMEKKCAALEGEEMSKSRIHSCILELKDGCRKESNEHNDMLQSASMGSSGVAVHRMADILELGNLRRALLIGSWVWDHRLSSLDSLLKGNVSEHAAEESIACLLKLQEVRKADSQTENNESAESDELLPVESELPPPRRERERDPSNLSERIDSAWTGTVQAANRVEILQVATHSDGVQARAISPTSMDESPPSSPGAGMAAPNQEKSSRRAAPAALDLPSSRPLQMLLPEAQNLSSIHSYTPSFISYSSSAIAGEARLLISQRSHNDMVIGVYDGDFSSIVACALNSRQYCDWVLSRGSVAMDEQWKETPAAASASPPSGPAELFQTHSGSYENLLPSLSTVLVESKGSQHLTVSYGDESFVAGGKVKFSVVCYFAKQFDSLRRKCCPNEVDFICSLSRCLRWGAQGGKSNVYFAKSLDERLIIKQVKKTELDSFIQFAPQYLKYLTDSLNSGSPTCLAKVLGIYQVTIKQLKGGKESKMDLVVMENLFFKRSISRVYDLKGSARSRYNPDTTRENAVLLDMNLVEAICKEPMFLGSKTKRKLERAIWNDTYFLASVDVMDYSLLVGVDEEEKELILGIIDYMRQYTWDKHLETWVKASGILGGPKNASPTVISPLQYKKRFRKAMSSYFLTVPDHWSS